MHTLEFTDSGCRLVEDEQLALAHYGTRERDDLALPDGQVAATAGDWRV